MVTFPISVLAPVTLKLPAVIPIAALKVPLTSNWYPGTVVLIPTFDTWTMNASYAGDRISDIQFSITNNGQIQYTSADIPGWVLTKMNFKANTTSV
ncbi:hypothetical protein EB077_13310 [bacterium]|nr:hypothetical protein [bacterium]